jgi:hypothetical protein
MPRRAVTVLLLVFAANVLARTAGSADDPSPGWDKAATARYLDARMDVWWTKAKVLKTGAGDTRCLSCHTAIPYALVRPALRRALGEDAPTAHEAKILETVTLRLQTAAAQQPFYDHTDDKKVESRGVEAVLSALVLASDNASTGTHDEGASGAERRALTRQAFERLWDAQRPDGAWDWLNFGLEPYETIDAAFHGATLAAMAAGSAAGTEATRDHAGQAGLAKLRAYLHANLDSQRLFNRAWALLASSRLPEVLSAEESDAIVRDLEAAQRPDGGWSLTDLGPWRWSKTEGRLAAPGATDAARLGAPDAYATGLVVYAMRQAGAAADRPAVRKGLAWLRANQEPARAGDDSWAPWRAHSLNFERERGGEKGEPWRRMFMSDMATAFAALALL